MLVCNAGAGLSAMTSTMRGSASAALEHAASPAAVLATKGSEYEALLAEIVSGQLAEAMAAYSHRWLLREMAHLDIGDTVGKRGGLAGRRARFPSVRSTYGLSNIPMPSRLTP